MVKLEFPKNYIIEAKPGEEFRLHSGGTSDVFFDVNALLKNGMYLGYVLDKIPHCRHYVGIATGGAAIARRISSRRKTKVSFIKAGKLKGEVPEDEWILIGDIATTGNSLLEAIALVGNNPREIIVVLDRRKENVNPQVNSIYKLPFFHP